MANKNSNLKISVIVPCYNQSHFLDECIDSLIAQTYSNWECILVNDGSTDGTEQKCLDWQQKDTRIKYLKKTNGGLSSARNAGLNYVTGNYIQFLDCDDFLMPQKFTLSIESLRDDDEVAVVITDFLLFEQKKKISKPPHCILESNCFNQEAILKEWDKRFTIPIHCALFPHQIIKKHRFDEELKAKEDWIFWLQVYEHPLRTVFIPTPLVFYRINDAGLTRNDAIMHENQMIAISKLANVIKDKELYHSFLSYNTQFYLNEIFALKKEILRQKEKRKLSYKFKKIAKLIGLK